MAVHDESPDIAETVDRIHFRKYLDETEYEIPTVVYEIESDRDDAVEVTLREAIPDSVSIEEVGFHRHKGAEYWDIDGDELVFEYTLSAGEAFTTVYAVRTDSTLLTENLLTSPTALQVEPVDAGVPDPTPMTRSSAESPYGSQRPTTTDADENDSNPAGGVDLGEAVAEESTDAEGTAGSLADELAEEIRAGEVSADSLNVLQDALLNEAIAGGAVDARLAQLQRDVGDLRAYKNALEAFLEDEGSAQEIIESFEERLDEVESEVSSLRSSVDTLESKSETYESELEAVDAELADISREHEVLVQEFESLAENVDAMDERVPEYPVDERMKDLEAEIESVGEFVENLKTAFK